MNTLYLEVLFECLFKMNKYGNVKHMKNDLFTLLLVIYCYKIPHSVTELMWFIVFKCYTIAYHANIFHHG